jgi:hypothetical protein
MSARSYTALHPAPICETLSRLARRIEERFPGSGLSRVAKELVVVADEDRRALADVQRPLWWVRSFTLVTIVALAALLIWAGLQLVHAVELKKVSVAELLQGLDAATNEVIVLSLGLYFLASLEARLKRRAALRRLHRLRSVAHVVDMHQLTKDPEYALRPVTPTASSPMRDFSRTQLARYLDYCSELLALTSKLAALHAQHLQDPVVLDAVNDIETLTADLSRKIWQKITIIDIGNTQLAARPETRSPDAPAG